MKKPRYYCENCGEEVGRNSKICPHCARFFTSVKCPKCGYGGEVAEFDSGCPVCGYAERITSAPSAQSEPKVYPQPSPLPIWVYVAVLLVLALVAGLLLNALR